MVAASLASHHKKHQAPLQKDLLTDKLKKSNFGRAILQMVELNTRVGSDWTPLFDALDSLKVSLLEKKQTETEDFQSDGIQHENDVVRLGAEIQTYEQQVQEYTEDLDNLVSSGNALKHDLGLQESRLDAAKGKAPSKKTTSKTSRLDGIMIRTITELPSKSSTSASSFSTSPEDTLDLPSLLLSKLTPRASRRPPKRSPRSPHSPNSTANHSSLPPSPPFSQNSLKVEKNSTSLPPPKPETLFRNSKTTSLLVSRLLMVSIPRIPMTTPTFSITSPMKLTPSPTNLFPKPPETSSPTMMLRRKKKNSSLWLDRISASPEVSWFLKINHGIKESRSMPSCSPSMILNMESLFKPRLLSKTLPTVDKSEKRVILSQSKLVHSARLFIESI
jgi:hypothetical protein